MTARHAATDGSFGRSAGGAAARGAGLLVLAVVLGILLLRAGGGDPYSRSVSTGSAQVTTATSLPPTATTVTVPLRPAGDVKVLPANGTSTAGAATNTGNRLRDSGYNILAASNTAKAATASNVFYVPGFEREARVVAQLLGLPDSAVQPLPNPSPVPDTREANLVVVVGPDLAKAGPPASPPTTRRSATTVRTATTARTATTRAATTTTR
jgi:LytR cell envelope-related transcriptional attenuator